MRGYDVNIMKLRLLQAFLTGIVAVLVFVCSIMGIDAAIRHFLPQLFAEMASLIFGPPEALIVLLVGLALSIFSVIWLLRQWSGRDRLWLILFGGITTLAWSLAIFYAFPATSRYILLVGVAFAGGVIFAVEAATLSTRLVYRAIFTLLLVVGGGWMAFDQYDSGTQRAQLDGLRHTGYVIYVPGDKTRYHLESIAPTNEQYNGYKNGVSVNLASRVYLIEHKVDHRPAPNCGSPFITAENDFNTDSDSLEDFSCHLVASKNNVEVYMLERKSYASFYDDYNVTRVYFAVAGGTWIYSNSILYVHSVLDPGTQNTAEKLKAFDDSKTMLLDLVPAGDLSHYLRRH